MSFIDSFYLRLMRRRLREIDSFSVHAEEIQQKQLQYLLQKAADTEYGRKYCFAAIRSEEDFRQRVPLITYPDLQPYVERLMRGENRLLWPTPIKWFSKSSGTTHSQSKYIPVSREALDLCHYKGGKDLFALYLQSHPESGVFSGKNISMGGSLHPWPANPDIQCGDVSAIITKDLPFWAELRRAPKKRIALMDEWESKLQKMAETTIRQDIRSFLGVPSWTLLFLRKALEISGKRNLREVWPDMELFVHGGVSFTPYAEQFKSLLGEPFSYWETYNASEGFFGIQHTENEKDMLLMLDYGVYYEFLPVEETGSAHPHTVTIGEVETGRNYALIISTNAGLWRYMIGDTIVFTSLKPYRFRISGRTRHFINTFGEELIIENADAGLAFACTHTKSEISEYTAAPFFLDADNHARHQWLIEFKRPPENIDAFTELLDTKLKDINSDYAAKRYNNLILKKPEIIVLPEGTFLAWLKEKNKLGGQHKVPRLSNNRQYADEILNLLNVSPQPCAETEPDETQSINQPCP